MDRYEHEENIDTKSVTFIYTKAGVSVHFRNPQGKASYRTTPNIRLLDRRSASGSTGSDIKSHSWAISALSTDLLGSFLKVDLEPKVAASLTNCKDECSLDKTYVHTIEGQTHCRVLREALV